MLRDEEWNLSDFEHERIVSALAYFADPIDLIPDHIPGIGFLDDAMFVEIVIRELTAEIDAYNEFCEYRIAEEARLTEEGLDPDENRDVWISAKRDQLHTRIQEARGAESEEEFVFHIL